jgi:hypothetical protein
MVLPGSDAKSVVFFRVIAGEIRGPAALSLDENVSEPIPLDRRLYELMQSLGGDPSRPGQPQLPSWEHLSLLSRWYYSSFRQGELVMLNPDQAIPHSRIIRICRKLLAGAQGTGSAG